MQFLDDRLHASTTHADASTDRIDVTVVGVHGDFRTAARLARCAFNLDDPLVDLRHFLLEQLDQETRMSPGEHDLRPLARELDVDDEGTDTVALAVALARDLLLLRQNGIGASEVHDDVLALEALHDARKELALPILELVENDGPFGLAHLLDDILLGSLRGDPTKFLLRELRQQLVTDLGLRVELFLGILHRHLIRGIRDLVDDGFDLEELDLADVRVELRLDLMLETELPARRGQHRLFESGDDDAFVDTLFLADLLDDAIQIGLHVVSFPTYREPSCCAERAEPRRSGRRFPTTGNSCW